ncbi:MAG: hypothetical protein K6G67_00645 [Lachnospiraceae bacterium]|nr:hypothetical protein [Lachnospiraceae bacterium]
MSENRSPLRIYCKNCGAPAGFDIINQTYRCTSCGEVTGIQEANESVYRWKELQKENLRTSPAAEQGEECSCPSCGARVYFPAGDASEKCVFCGSKIVRGELTDASQLPDMIIPFVITPDEAKKRMLDWGHKHEKTPEGKSVVSSMGQFSGYYLPYRIVKGPVYADVSRDGNDRKYECGGFIEGTAVNTSKQLDNLVLNEMEPFDWSAARPFEYGLIAGMPVKLNDSSDADIDSRIIEEVAEDFRPEVEKVMQTSGVEIHAKTGNMSTLTALLPVYFIKSGKLTAVMNGQTGRIAVSKERKKVTYPWIIEPLIYTTILTLIMGWWSQWNTEMIFYSAIVFGLIIFCVMGEGRGSLIRRVTLKSKASAAKRQDGELVIDESKNILKNPYDNTPVFYEADEKGQKVPVRIKFYTIGRILAIMFNGIITVTLPALIGAFFRWCSMEEGETFMEGFHPLYGAAWYTLTALIVLLYFVKGVRKDAYDHPIIYKLFSNGSKKLMGKRRDRKLSVLSLFGVGSKDKDGKRVTVFRLIRDLGGVGVGMALLMIFIFLGSTLAMVF